MIIVHMLYNLSIIYYCSLASPTCPDSQQPKLLQHGSRSIRTSLLMVDYCQILEYRNADHTQPHSMSPRDVLGKLACCQLSARELDLLLRKDQSCTVTYLRVRLVKCAPFPAALTMATSPGKVTFTRQQRSEHWQHFDLVTVEKKKFSRCKECRQMIKYFGGTSNIKMHWQKHMEKRSPSSCSADQRTQTAMVAILMFWVGHLTN